MYFSNLQFKMLIINSQQYLAGRSCIYNRFLYMFKCLVLLFLIFSCNSNEKQENNISQQNSDTLKFIEYKDFELAYKSGKNMKQLSNNFDFLSILLLDSTHAKTLFKFDPKLKVNLTHASASAKLSESTVAFRTYLETLRDVLQSEKSRDLIPSCLYGEEAVENEYKINNPIYINGNVAVVEFFNVSSSFICYINLFD